MKLVGNSDPVQLDSERSANEDPVARATTAVETVENAPVPATPTTTAIPITDPASAMTTSSDENVEAHLTPEKLDIKKSGCRAALAKQRRPYCRDALTDRLRGPPLVVLPAGQIEIGGRNAVEQPRRLITIERHSPSESMKSALGNLNTFALQRRLVAQRNHGRIPNIRWSMCRGSWRRNIRNGYPRRRVLRIGCRARLSGIRGAGWN